MSGAWTVSSPIGHSHKQHEASVVGMWECVLTDHTTPPESASSSESAAPGFNLKALRSWISSSSRKSSARTGVIGSSAAGAANGSSSTLLAASPPASGRWS